jgi:hypothetical protein
MGASGAGREQVDALRGLLARNIAIGNILDRAPELGLPHWYLGAGCIAQTAWNLLSGFPAGRAIEDYDLVYYDATDLSAEAEARRAGQTAELFRDLGVRVDL